MPAQRNQPSTRPAATTRAGSTTARRGDGGNGNGRRNNRAASWPVGLSNGTAIDLGEGIIPIHILNLICAVHLRQEHGFKQWQIGRFKESYPWLIREDGTFAFAARIAKHTSTR